MNLSVIGLGKLGLPLAVVLADKGHNVIGVDLNREFVDQINLGQAPFEEENLQELLTENRLQIQATTEYDLAIGQTEATFVIVPTPSQPDGFFTNRYVLDAVQKIGVALREKNQYHLVVITSTVMPGSTEGKIKQRLEETSGLKVGKNIGLCYNPEFIALGSVVRNMIYPDMILIGESDVRAGDQLQKIYESVCEQNPPIQRMSCVNAELTKLSVNTFITTKISYANMLGGMCEMIPGADAEVITEAIGLDSRIGRKYLKAAVAFGGPCFPRDNVAFTALADRLGARSDIAEATQAINHFQPERLKNIIKQHAIGKRVGILGLSYKPGTYIVEESPGIKIANQLSQEDFEVFAYDPMAYREAQKELESNVHVASSFQECVLFSDTLIIMTPWPEFSKMLTPELLREKSSVNLIIDCWRILSESDFSAFCQVIYLGQSYEKQEELVSH